MSGICYRPLPLSAVSAAMKRSICSFNWASTSSAMVTMLGSNVLNSKCFTFLCNVVKMLTCALLLMLCSAPNALHGRNTKRPTTEAGSRSPSGSADACKDSTVKFDTPYQAILLANGFVYFGHLQDFGSANPVMTDVFYIVTAHDDPPRIHRKTF